MSVSYRRRKIAGDDRTALAPNPGGHGGLVITVVKLADRGLGGACGGGKKYQDHARERRLHGRTAGRTELSLISLKVHFAMGPIAEGLAGGMAQRHRAAGDFAALQGFALMINDVHGPIDQ